MAAATFAARRLKSSHLHRGEVSPRVNGGLVLVRDDGGRAEDLFNNVPVLALSKRFAALPIKGNDLDPNSPLASSIASP